MPSTALAERYVAETKRATGRWLSKLSGLSKLSAEEAKQRIQDAVVGGLSYFAAQHLQASAVPAELSPAQLEVLTELVTSRLGNISVLDRVVAHELATAALLEATTAMQQAPTQPAELELACGTATVLSNGAWVLVRRMSPLGAL